MPEDVLVSVQGLSKKFCRDLKLSLWYGVKDMASELTGGRKEADPKLRKQEFWALRDINFELKRGECLGLIGRNGAGKSTLLKLLNGLIRPDQGRIEMRGRVGALIELGAGFNPILTGRENIFVNGSILGFSKNEITRLLDQIIDFAEVRDFIDTPVQYYSSGMKIRLGFSVAAHLDPDILLVDEVLAVGDLYFKLKCFGLIDQLMERCCIIFVTHSMQMVSRLCNRVMIIDGGTTAFSGYDVSLGIEEYYRKFAENKPHFVRSGVEVSLKEFRINHSNDEVPLIPRLDDLHLAFQIKIGTSHAHGILSVVIQDHEQKTIGICINERPISQNRVIESDHSLTTYQVELTIPRITMSKGLYHITLTFNEEYNKKPLARLNHVKSFKVLSHRDIWAPMELEGRWT